jgi:hypothetical protein
MCRPSLVARNSNVHGHFARLRRGSCRQVPTDSLPIRWQVPAGWQSFTKTVVTVGCDRAYRCKVPGAKVPGAKVLGAKVLGAKVLGAKVPGAKVLAASGTHVAPST